MQMPPTRSTLTTLALAGVLTGGTAMGASGDAYPSRPIRFVVPYPAGTTTDIIARQIMPKASELLGQSVVIDNRPGAGGTIGTAFVAKAAADGYTLVIGTPQTFAVAQSLYPEVAYDPVTGFAAIGRIARNGMVLAVNASMPVNSVADLIAHARANPGKLNYTSTGVGGTPHLAAALFANEAGLRVTHVPYPSPAQGVVAILGGDVHFMFYSYLVLSSHASAGRVKLLAVSTAQRFPHAPQLPTMIEAGFQNFDMTSWHGVYAPAKTAKRIVETFSDALQRVLSDPEMLAIFRQTGNEINPAGPAEQTAFTKSERERYRKIVAVIGLTSP
jgi:tripartite-type tricarboxylate transporter receptor subunit TctC